MRDAGWATSHSQILTAVKKPPLLQPDRLRAVVIYTAVFLLIGRVVAGQFPPPDLGGLWFYAGAAALVLGTFLQEPFVSTPADALLNGVALLVTMITLTPEGSQADPDVVQLGRFAFMDYAGVVLGLAAVAIGFKDEAGFSGRLAAASARLARLLGSGAVLYSLVFFAACYAAFADHSAALAALYLTWIVFFLVAPVERALAFIAATRKSSRALGTVEQVVDPGIVVVRARPGATVEIGTQLELGTPPRTGVVVSVTSLLGEPRLRVALAARSAVRVGSDVQLKAEPPSPSIVGFTDIGTTLSELKVELIPGGAEQGLEIGRLLEVAVAKRRTLYQIVSAEIDKDAAKDHVRTPAHAAATKIGRWNEELSTFDLEPWMPEPGSPAALVAEVDAAFESKYLGHVPKTAYGVRVKIHAAVTHNTAILGILGVGKTTLAWELIRRMLAEGIKVVVLDITGKYAQQFADLCPPAVQENHEQAIRDQIAGRLEEYQFDGGDAGNVGDFDAALRELLARFIHGPARLLILNPNRFEVSRSGSGVSYQRPGFAVTLARLSMVDITRKVSEILLEIVQFMPEPQDEKARICLVLEEAHSLVPEWNSTTQDHERESVNGTVRAVLQGRKYGYGCLLITQRTANVTKSILNQCNTILGMRVYDTTGMGFLENYIGEAHSRVLGALKNQQAVFFGRASTCEAPIVLQLNKAKAFRDGFWAPIAGGIAATSVFDDLEGRPAQGAAILAPADEPEADGGPPVLDDDDLGEPAEAAPDDDDADENATRAD